MIRYRADEIAAAETALEQLKDFARSIARLHLAVIREQARPAATVRPQYTPRPCGGAR
jgi:hypothetical protein